MTPWRETLFAIPNAWFSCGPLSGPGTIAPENPAADECPSAADPPFAHALVVNSADSSAACSGRESALREVRLMSESELSLLPQTVFHRRSSGPPVRTEAVSQAHAHVADSHALRLPDLPHSGCAATNLAEYDSSVTDVAQRRLRDSWGLIGVIVLAVFFVASAVYRVAQQDWASAVAQAAFGAILIGVLVYSRTRPR